MNIIVKIDKVANTITVDTDTLKLSGMDALLTSSTINDQTIELLFSLYIPPKE